MIDSFGVKMFPATKAKSEIHFRETNRKSGERVRHQMAYTLRYAEELRRAGESFPNVKTPPIDAEHLALAKELIKCAEGKFDSSGFTDNYEAALRELAEAKLKHVRLPAESKPAARGKVIN